MCLNAFRAEQPADVSGQVIGRCAPRSDSTPVHRRRIGAAGRPGRDTNRHVAVRLDDSASLVGGGRARVLRVRPETGGTSIRIVVRARSIDPVFIAVSRDAALVAGNCLAAGSKRNRPCPLRSSTAGHDDAVVPVDGHRRRLSAGEGGYSVGGVGGAGGMEGIPTCGDRAPIDRDGRLVRTTVSRVDHDTTRAASACRYRGSLVVHCVGIVVTRLRIDPDRFPASGLVAGGGDASPVLHLRTSGRRCVKGFHTNGCRPVRANHAAAFVGGSRQTAFRECRHAIGTTGRFRVPSSRDASRIGRDGGRCCISTGPRVGKDSYCAMTVGSDRTACLVRCTSDAAPPCRVVPVRKRGDAFCAPVVVTVAVGGDGAAIDCSGHTSNAARSDSASSRTSGHDTGTRFVDDLHDTTS